MIPELNAAQDDVHTAVTHLVGRDRTSASLVLAGLDEQQTLRFAMVAADLAAWLITEWADTEDVPAGRLWSEMALRVAVWREGVAADGT